MPKITEKTLVEVYDELNTKIMTSTQIQELSETLNTIFDNCFKLFHQLENPNINTFIPDAKTCQKNIVLAITKLNACETILSKEEYKQYQFALNEAKTRIGKLIEKSDGKYVCSPYFDFFNGISEQLPNAKFKHYFLQAYNPMIGSSSGECYGYAINPQNESMALNRNEYLAWIRKIRQLQKANHNNSNLENLTWDRYLNHPDQLIDDMVTCALKYLGSNIIISLNAPWLASNHVFLFKINNNFTIEFADANFFHLMFSDSTINSYNAIISEVKKLFYGKFNNNHPLSIWRSGYTQNHKYCAYHFSISHPSGSNTFKKKWFPIGTPATLTLKHFLQGGLPFAIVGAVIGFFFAGPFGTSIGTLLGFTIGFITSILFSSTSVKYTCSNLRKSIRRLCGLKNDTSKELGPLLTFDHNTRANNNRTADNTTSPSSGNIKKPVKTKHHRYSDYLAFDMSIWNAPSASDPNVPYSEIESYLLCGYQHRQP